MNTFTMEIQGPKYKSFDDLISFTGRDRSGSFGILAHAERRITVLTFGLATFQRTNHKVEYLALPGGLFYFRENSLTIVTRNYVQDSDYEKITEALDKEIRISESVLQETKRSLRRLDEEILRRLSRLNWKGQL